MVVGLAYCHPHIIYVYLDVQVLEARAPKCYTRKFELSDSFRGVCGGGGALGQKATKSFFLAKHQKERSKVIAPHSHSQRSQPWMDTSPITTCGFSLLSVTQECCLALDSSPSP